ncbi:MAG: hypothetical protein RIT81_39760 [Deltaproteobacteria bacterium]
MSTRPRDRRLRAVFVTAVATFAAAGCTEVSPLALVMGELVEMPLEVSTVVARSAGVLVAATPVASNGAFVVAVPETPLLEVTFATADGATYGMDQVFAVCSTEATIDLGAIFAVPDPSQCPTQPQELCTQAQLILTRCFDDTAVVCDGLHEQLTRCHTDEESVCGPLRASFEACIEMTSPCEEELDALTMCEAMFDCGALGEMVGARCGDPCAVEQATHDAVCAEPPEPCAPGFVFVVEEPVISDCATGVPPL